MSFFNFLNISFPDIKLLFFTFRVFIFLQDSGETGHALLVFPAQMVITLLHCSYSTNHLN